VIKLQTIVGSGGFNSNLDIVTGKACLCIS